MSDPQRSIRISSVVRLPDLPRDPKQLHTHLRHLHDAIQDLNLDLASRFEILETQRIIKGTLSDRPEASGSGAIYLVTDATPPTLSWDDPGVEGWVEIGS